MATLSKGEYERRLKKQFLDGARSRDAEVAELQKFKPIQQLVIVSRLWNEPRIRVQYTVDGIMIDMTAAEFARAVASAVRVETPPYPSWWRRLLMKRFVWSGLFEIAPDRIEDAALASFAQVTDEMKQATVNSPPPIGVSKQ